MARQDTGDVSLLDPYMPGFGQRLEQLGYRDRSAAHQRRLFTELGRWLDAHGLAPGELTDERLDEFLTHRRRGGIRRHITSRAVSPAVAYLRGLGVVPGPSRPAPVDPAGALVERYHDYLVGQRGLTHRVVAAYETEVAGFLAAAAPGGPADVAVLTTADVSEFLAAASARRSRGSVANLVPALRSFLRFAHVEGLTGRDLAAAVGGLARRGGRVLPTVLSPAQVACLIDSCDRRRGIGRRDRAILVVLARLGLRAGEVASLGLDDIDWRAGQVVVHGKGPRDEVLPLPADVGDAIADYLARGRSRVESRAVFVRASRLGWR